MGDPVARRRLVSIRLRQGRDRVRNAAVPVLVAAVAAGLAYAIAHYGLGHAMPVFAPIAAWVCLGFQHERELRRVAELAVGVAVGVGFGDLVAHLIGSGPWQIGLTLAAAALLARFLDRGQMLTTQAGVQAIVIIGMPQISAGPVGRWTDALIGGAMALLVAILTPGDPRRYARRLAGEATRVLAEAMRVLARGLRTGDHEDLRDALARGRTTQPLLEEWLASARAGYENTRIDASTRRYREDFVLLERQAVLIDRAVRSVRVLARRVEGLGPDAGRDLSIVAPVVGETAQAVQELAGALLNGTDLGGPRRALEAAAALADPGQLGETDWYVQSLVVLMRSPIVDLLEATGASPEEARAALPVI